MAANAANPLHVVVGHSSCGWTTKQVADLPTGSLVVMCDKTPDDAACKSASAYPTHLVCSDAKHEDCRPLATGFKPSAELTALLSKLT